MRFRILGTLEVHGADGWTGIGAANARAVLAGNSSATSPPKATTSPLPEPTSPGPATAVLTTRLRALR